MEYQKIAKKTDGPIINILNGQSLCLFSFLLLTISSKFNILYFNIIFDLIIPTNPFIYYFDLSIPTDLLNICIDSLRYYTILPLYPYG